MREQTKQKIEKVEKLMARGFNQTNACKRVGLSPLVYRQAKETSSNQPTVEVSISSRALRGDAFAKRILFSNLVAEDKIEILRRSYT